MSTIDEGIGTRSAGSALVLTIDCCLVTWRATANWSNFDLDSQTSNQNNLMIVNTVNRLLRLLVSHFWQQNPQRSNRQGRWINKMIPLGTELKSRFSTTKLLWILPYVLSIRLMHEVDVKDSCSVWIRCGGALYSLRRWSKPGIQTVSYALCKSKKARYKCLLVLKACWRTNSCSVVPRCFWKPPCDSWIILLSVCHLSSSRFNIQSKI